MATKDTLFTVVGITTHRGTGACGTVSERTKVRYGTDLVRLIKMLNNPKKIENKTLGICLAPVRVDFVELPRPMLKLEALQHALTVTDFQSPSDQAVIQDAIDSITPRPSKVRVAKPAKAPKTVKAKTVADSAETLLDAIKSRPRVTKRSTVSVEDVLAARAEVESANV